MQEEGNTSRSARELVVMRSEQKKRQKGEINEMDMEEQVEGKEKKR